MLPDTTPCAPESAPVSAPSQFRLARFQVFNWGTFHGVADIAISDRGYLFVGPSGSGKSTLLDANSALMTPPKWLGFNIAAREDEKGGGADRNLMTYVRGAYGQQTGKTGECVQLFLRNDTTWSALAQTYRNAGTGSAVTLAQVFWVRGKSTSKADVRRLYLVAEREFDVREFQAFADSDFEPKKLRALPQVAVFDEFSGYFERFSRLMGLDHLRALRLLHKTQSAKNLGELSAFLRDFMLDEPETFGVAASLVEQFQELRDAHAAVVSARLQFETLAPAKTAHDELKDVEGQQATLAALSAGLDAQREQTKHQLLSEDIAAVEQQLQEQPAVAEQLQAQQDAAFRALNDLQVRRHGGSGAVIERLEGELSAAQATLKQAKARLTEVAAACQQMQWEVPASASTHAELLAEVEQFIADSDDRTTTRREKRDALRGDLETATRAFQAARAEAESLAGRRSSISPRTLQIRQRMCEALRMPEHQLPFAGELIEVPTQHAAWQGAIERVLHSFAESMLVSESDYPQVSRYLNETHLGGRLVYLRVTNADRAPALAAPNPKSMLRKLELADHEHRDWLERELASRFDYTCADSVDEFRRLNRAVTIEGLVKHSASRHEKNDTVNVNDRSRWVLGFDNTAKRELFEERARECALRLAPLQQRLAALDSAEASERQGILTCHKLQSLTWVDVDVDSAQAAVDTLVQQLSAAREDNPDMEALDADISAQTATYQKAVAACTQQAAKTQNLRDRLSGLQSRRDGLNKALLAQELAPEVRAALDERFARLAGDTTQSLSLARLDELTMQVSRQLAAQDKELSLRASKLQARVTACFSEFIRQWPAEAGGLDANLASADDFFAILQRLTQDGLPAYEDRFMQLLQNQGDQGITHLSLQLDKERKAIRDRMAAVNESLVTAPFNKGTHLVIETQDMMLPEVQAFRRELKEIVAQTAGETKEQTEARFVALNKLVTQLASQESDAKGWRSRVLDVRQHVDFLIREVDDATGAEIEAYRSGAGKSGGQRQKLTATCLAAALRYQLGGRDTGLPMFSTVFMDEAFDKADAEFTALAMNIFKTFGFQLVVATPMKSVMVLEPFIGGACFVYIENRNKSKVLPIDYDLSAGRLALSDRARAEAQE